MASYLLIDDQLIPIAGAEQATVEENSLNPKEENYNREGENIGEKENLINKNNIIYNVNESACNDNKEKEYKEWTGTATRSFIALYKKYRPKVGSFEMRNLKLMFEKISTDMKQQNLNYSANNCSNRWKVLERKYKDFIDNQKKTGRSRKYFEFFDEMQEILGKKKSINPPILLTANTEILNNITQDTENQEVNAGGSANLPSSTTESEDVNKRKAEELSGNTKKYKQDLLTEIRKHKLAFYKEKKIALQEMVSEKKRYYTERLQIEKEKTEAIRSQTDILLSLLQNQKT